MLKTCILVMTLLIFVWAGSAYAYLDPGTGSMLVQAFIAAVAAVSVTLGIFKRRIRAFFNRLRGRDTSAEGIRSDDGQ